MAKRPWPMKILPENRGTRRDIWPGSKPGAFGRLSSHAEQLEDAVVPVDQLPSTLSSSMMTKASALIQCPHIFCLVQQVVR